MITVVYRVVAKTDKVTELESIIAKFTRIARSSNDCRYYSFYRSLTNSNEFIVYYNFSSKKAQDEHIIKLHELVGPPSPGRDLPKKFLDLLSDEELVLFKDKDIQ